MNLRRCQILLLAAALLVGVGVPGTAASQTATFYDSTNCTGPSFTLWAGQEHHRLSEITGGWNDRISSVRLDANMRVFIFVHKEFGKGPGTLQSIGASTCATLRQARMSSGKTWDNEISSLIVVRHPNAFMHQTVVIQSFLMSEHCLRWEHNGSVAFHFCTNATNRWPGGRPPVEIARREAFRVVPSLIGAGPNSSGFSFEAVGRPRHYLVIENGTMALRPFQANDAFRDRASFKISPGKGFVQWYSIAHFEKGQVWGTRYISARRNPPFLQYMANKKEVRKEITFNFLPYAPDPEQAAQQAAASLAALARDGEKSLALAPGWAEYCRVFRSSGCRFAPAKAVRVDGMVHVSGLLVGPGGRWFHIATLPDGMRPAYRRVFHLNRYGKSVRVDVMPDGRILWHGGAKGRDRQLRAGQDWVSLDGIAFAASVGRTLGAPTLAQSRSALTLVPGWSSVAAPRPRLVIARTKDDAPAMAESVGATVVVGGLVTGPCRTKTSRGPMPQRRGHAEAACGFKFNVPTIRPPAPRQYEPWNRVASGRIATLPDGLRPAQRLIFNLDHDNHTSRVDVLTNGEIRWLAGGPGCGRVSLDGITFSLNPGTPLQLAPGWSNYAQGYQRATVIREGRRVVVSGLVKGPRRVGAVIATLPPGARPIHQLVFSVNQDADSARVDVHPDGRIVWVDGPTNRDWLPLDGIRFATR